MTAAKIMDIISRLPGCDGQAADAVSAYTQVKMEDAHKLLKISKTEGPDIWIRLPRHKWPKSWSSIEDPEKILLKHGWEKIPKCECLFVHREKGLFLSVYVDDIKLAGKKQNLDPMWKLLNKEVDLGEPTSFPRSKIPGVYSKRMWTKQRYCWHLQNHVLNREFPQGELKNYHALKIFVFLRGPTIWKVMPRNVLNAFVSWQTRRLNSFTKYLLHALMTTISKKKNSNLLENCQMHALKLFWNAYAWHALVDRFFWSVNKFARAITWWTRGCDKRLARSISYIHHTCEFKQYCHVGHTAQQCRSGLFQDFFCRRSGRLKINLRWTVEHFLKSHVRAKKVGCARSRLHSASHSSTEAEIVSQDAGLRMDGIPALDLWDFGHGSVSLFTKPTRPPKIKYEETGRVTPHQTRTTKTKPRFQPSTTILIWVVLIVSRRSRDAVHF